MDESCPGFATLPADQRSWVMLVAQAGIASFVEWLRSPDDVLRLTGEVFAAAPARWPARCTLQQTVELVRARPSRWSRSRCRSSARRRAGRCCARSCCGSAGRSPSPPPGCTRARPRCAAPGTHGWRRWSSTVLRARRRGSRRCRAQPVAASAGGDRLRSRRWSARPRRGTRSEILTAVHARPAHAGLDVHGRRARRPAGRRARRGRATPLAAARPCCPVRRRAGRGRAGRARPGRAPARRPGPRWRAARGARLAGAPRPVQRRRPAARAGAGRRCGRPRAAGRGRLPPAGRGRGRACSRPSPRISKPAARWRPRPARCSSTPTPSGTGCAGSPRCAAAPRPTRGPLTLRLALVLGRLEG